MGDYSRYRVKIGTVEDYGGVENCRKLLKEAPNKIPLIQNEYVFGYINRDTIYFELFPDRCGEIWAYCHIEDGYVLR